jgi:hypothetical protein
MRFLKNFLMGIGAVALAAALVNLLAPQAVHATVAALVQVANTATNPVLTSSIDDPGRNPYVEFQYAPSCINQGICTLSFSAVPAGKRLVLTNISGQFHLTVAGTEAQVLLTTNIGNPHFYDVPAIPQGISNGTNEFRVVNQTILAFGEAGTTADVRVVLGGGVFTGSPDNVSFTLSGYYINLP